MEDCTDDEGYVEMDNVYWKNKKILVIGASSDLCTEIIPKLVDGMGRVGLHYNTNKDSLLPYAEAEHVHIFQQNFTVERETTKVVDDFIAWAGGIDFLIIMVGNCTHPVFWENLTADDMLEDYYINTVVPFKIAQYAQKYMRAAGGRIIFTGTASAQNAGGSNSLSYGAAKLGLECIMKRMAKDCAQNHILINMVDPGFIMSKFHTQVMKRSEEELLKRAQFVPLKRAGNFKEVAEPYFFLLSENASFITGEVINVKGGDWI